MTVRRRLDAVCYLTMGQAPVGESYNSTGNGLPLIAGAGDFGEAYPAVKKHSTAPSKTCAPGDIVLGIRATIGEKVIADREYCLGRGVAGLRPRPGLDIRYLWHWLTEAAPRLAAKAKGATFKQVNREDIGELQIALPSLAEQRRIAAILDKADALRAKRRAALARLDSLAQSIFYEMFGDPVANPLGWKDHKLDHAVSLLQYGPRFYNQPYADDGVRIARITDLDHAGDLHFESMPRMRISNRDAEQFSLLPGDLLFARSGATVGKVALFRAGDPPTIPGAYFIRIRLKPEVTPEYAKAVLTTSSVQAIIAAQSRQAAQQNFSGPGLRRLPMPLPAIALQQEFAARMRAIQRLKQNERTGEVKIGELFASLQHRAFRGEL